MNGDILLNNLDVLISVSTLIFAFYIFLRDPLRRWEFMGYLPKLIVIPVDKKTLEILFINPFGYWGFVQGNITGSNFRGDVLDVIQRDIGLNSYDYKLIGTKIIGKRRIISKDRLRESHIIGGIRLFNSPRGKGYVAAYVLVDKKKLLGKINLGYGIEKYKFVQIDTVDDFLKKNVRQDKIDFYKDIINETREIVNK